MKGSYRNGGWQRLTATEDYCCLLALAGEGTLGGMEIKAGEGMLLDASRLAEREEALPREYLKLEFSERNLLRIFGEHGVRADGTTFALTQTRELAALAQCYFSTEREVENGHRQSALVELILTYTEAGHEGRTEDTTSTGYVRYAEEYIQEHLGESIQVDTIAEKLGITRGYLRNVFFAVHGMSPREYLTETRIRRAEELLKEGDRTVTSVASEVGYEDMLQFSRIFKKHTGVSPSQYRSDNGVVIQTVRNERPLLKREEKKPVEIPAAETPQRKKKDPVWLF